MNELPEIRIFLADLLFYGESQKLLKNDQIESYEQFTEWTENYRKAWNKYEKRILTALQDVLSVSFYKSVIDVPCAPGFISKSDPLIMSYQYGSDQFVDALTHELCHVLLTDNDKNQIHSAKGSVNLVEEWTKLFGEHEFTVLVHIPVHALCKYIFCDVLKDPSRIERDIADIRSFDAASDYLKSWQYVQEHGYKAILEKLRNSYAEMNL